jgi:hypothetical protein
MRAISLVLLLVLGNDPGVRLAPGSVQGATITGQVVDARTRQPLRGAIVSAAKVPSNRPGDLPNIGFRTGQDGRFVLRGVAPGIVNFQVTKTGYLPGPYASVRPAVDGEQIDNVMLTVPPASAVGGRILDESGRPAAGALVTARRVAPVGGTAKMSLPQHSTRTDDDGQYWIGGLGAGDHNLMVQPSGGPPGPSGQSTGTVISATVRGETLVAAPAAGPQVVNVGLAIGENLADVNLVVRLPVIVGLPGRPADKTGTGAVSGRVIDPSGRGVANVFVSIAQDARTFGSLVSTDSDGAFRFMNVPAGSFTVSARGVRSVAAPAAPEGPSTAPVVVAEGSQIENLVLTVRRGGTITGTITDEFGDPVSGSVIVMNATRQAFGEITSAVRLGQDGGGIIPGRGTPVNARGQYRITDLPPGDYMVGLSMGDAVGNTEIHFRDYGGNDRLLARTMVFYPGVTTASQASRISLSEDSESTNVDLVLRPMPLAQVTVTISASRPAGEIQLYLVLVDDRLSILERWTKLTGSTVTLHARPGRYRLLASAEVASSVDNVTRLWASTDVEADPLLPATANMVLEPGVNIAGRVVFESANPLRQDAGAWLMPMESFPGIRIETIDGNSTFTVSSGEFLIEGVLPGRYVIQAGGAEKSVKSPWMLKAAILGGRDVLDVPIEFGPGEEITDARLTVTDRISELTGKVSGASDRQIGDESVVVFSADQRHWWAGSRRTRVVRPDAKGLYTVRALPPGAYIVTLLPNPVAQDELLSSLPALAGTGVRVTIGDGERKVQDLVSRRR